MTTKAFFFTAVIATLFATASAQCEGGRYRDFIVTDVVKTADVNYGANINQQGVMQQLMMDVYVPAGDVETNRPVVIVCHGGYFLYGDKAAVDVVTLCEDLAKMGYVVASLNYRMGITFQTPLNAPYGQAVVRAVQDLRAAIRWFRKDAAEGSNQFGIDPDNIYAGGDSAGGFMALHLAYMDIDEVPAFIDLTVPGLEGGMEGESGNPGYSSEVNAIFNVSGAIGDTSWIDINDHIPACLFHGDADETVPFDSGVFFLFGMLEVTELDGSNSIDQKMDELGLEHCFEINEGLGHVAYLGNTAVYDTTLSIISNFISHYVCDVPLDCSYRAIAAGLDEISASDFSLFPNPASESFRITSKKLHHFTQCDIIDVSGKSVKQLRFVNSQDIDVRGLPKGFYTVRLSGVEKSVEMKLVVE